MRRINDDAEMRGIDIQKKDGVQIPGGGGAKGDN